MSAYRNVFAVRLAIGCAGAALARDYASDLMKTNPAAERSWRAIVPAEFRSRTWIYRLSGVETPVEALNLHGRPFFAGNVCIPHDCGGNFVAFLIAADGREAFGELDSEALGVKHRYFGAPDEAAKAVLDKLARP
jgi:hypothetical protein